MTGCPPREAWFCARSRQGAGSAAIAGVCAPTRHKTTRAATERLLVPGSPQQQVSGWGSLVRLTTRVYLNTQVTRGTHELDVRSPMKVMHVRPREHLLTETTKHTGQGSVLPQKRVPTREPNHAC